MRNHRRVSSGRLHASGWPRIASVGLILAVAASVPVLSGAATSESASAQAPDRDCTDFPSQQAAQDYFISRGGPAQDQDRLDADHNGIACESLPCPCSTAAGTPAPAPEPPPTTPALRAETLIARVVRVIDGDTIRVRGGRLGRATTVRLIGIDTPESRRPNTPVECGARQAGSFLRRLLLAPSGRGRTVRLSTDPTQDRSDRFGRLLRYTNVVDGPDAALALVRAGWAKVYVYAGVPFQRVAAFRAAERAAREAGRGVWGLCGGDFHHPA